MATLFDAHFPSPPQCVPPRSARSLALVLVVATAAGGRTRRVSVVGVGRVGEDKLYATPISPSDGIHLGLDMRQGMFIRRGR